MSLTYVQDFNAGQRTSMTEMMTNLASEKEQSTEQMTKLMKEIADIKKQPAPQPPTGE